MFKSEKEVFRSKRNTLVLAILCTVILIYYFKQEQRHLFSKSLNPGIFSWAGILMFLTGSLFWWRIYFDRRPVLSITTKGVKFRLASFFSDKVREYSWNEVNYFYILEETRKMTTQSIVFGIRNIEKEQKLECNELDIDILAIACILKEYAVVHNFQDLGFERRP
jgi:hypothetical protein